MEGYEKRYSFFEGYFRAMVHMDDRQELEFRRAIDAFAFDGVAPAFSDPMLLMAWDLIVSTLEKSIKLSNAGRKGGRGNKAFKPSEKAFKPPFNEVEEEGEVEEEKKVVGFDPTTYAASFNRRQK